jgi:hypothetical protein
VFGNGPVLIGEITQMIQLVGCTLNSTYEILPGAYPDRTEGWSLALKFEYDIFEQFVHLANKEVYITYRGHVEERIFTREHTAHI